MIVAARPDGSIELVTQVDHAHFSAELLGLWRTDGLPEHERRGSLLRAVREHDNGWRETDSAPRLDPIRPDRPYDFLRLPDPLRIELWRRGYRRFLESRPYVSLLIVEHGCNLFAQREGTVFGPFRNELDEVRVRLLEELDLPQAALEEDYAYLELTDLISLVACSRWSGPFELRGRRIHLEGDRLVLEPFPLAGRTTFRIPYRRLSGRSYRGDAELAGELAGARWQHRELTVTPLA